LLRCAIAKARAELQRSEPKGGTLLVFYFRITKETKSNFEIEAESFGFGHLKLEEELLERNTDFDELKARAGRHGEEVASSIMDFSLVRPLKATFFGPAGNTTSPGNL
jgi:hypothetical protein